MHLRGGERPRLGLVGLRSSMFSLFPGAADFPSEVLGMEALPDEVERRPLLLFSCSPQTRV